MKAKIKHGAIAVLAITALSLVLRLAAPGPDRIKPWWWGVSDAEYQRALREQQALADDASRNGDHLIGPANR